MKNSRTALRAIAGALTCSWLISCAGSPVGDSVQQSLEADPQLEESPPFSANSADEPAAEDDEIAATETSEPTPPAANRETSTSPANTARAPEPGERGFIGPLWSQAEPADSTAPQSEPDPGSETAESANQATSDLAGVPADLQSYIRDLQTLDVIEPVATVAAEDSPQSTTAAPFTSAITRREYAQWLFDSHNAIYADEPGDRLRAGNPNDEPAFQDVAATDPNFAAIQGLAEAGLIPSAFTGNSTAVNFRPDAPLVREDLILWKVPLDSRTALPTTTPEAVTTAWGFQDTATIDPLPLRAIAADFQLGDFANFRRAFGYTTLFRPDKAVTRAEAAAVLWRFGSQTEGQTAADIAEAPD
ncbi:MAG: S-layer homology domain-containing protein [Cyanobacteria bacterium P01_D01_bin.115]